MHQNPGEVTVIQSLLDRLKAGDTTAKEELIAYSLERFQGLARKMLRENLAVRRWNQTDDVLQNALIRLNRALHTECPETTRRFIGLMATQIRRELIDLWRHHYGPEGDGAHHATDPGKQDSEGRGTPLHDQETPETKPGGLTIEEMEQFHTEVGKLPEHLREVFEKCFYLEMTQEEVAHDIGVSSKTIKRRWRDAKLQLAENIHLSFDSSK